MNSTIVLLNLLWQQIVRSFISNKFIFEMLASSYDGICFGTPYIDLTEIPFIKCYTNEFEIISEIAETSRKTIYAPCLR